MRTPFWLLLTCVYVSAAEKINPIRVWQENELAGWATPVAGLNVRPSHYSETEYYAAPEGEWLRTYPLYCSGS